MSDRTRVAASGDLAELSRRTLHERCFAADDRVEGGNAFLAARTPRFGGR